MCVKTHIVKFTDTGRQDKDRPGQLISDVRPVEVKCYMLSNFTIVIIFLNFINLMWYVGHFHYTLLRDKHCHMFDLHMKCT